MATAFVATTPTRARSPASIRTPQTPRLGGFGDSWEPYSPAPRKSARLSSRITITTSSTSATTHTQSRARTPSPHSSGRAARPSHHLRSSPRTAASSSAAQSSRRQTDVMASPPATSPQKKRQPASASRSVSGSLTAESIRNAATVLGHPTISSDSHLARSVAAATLPTPAKTPASKHTKQSEKDVTAIARTLFSKQQHKPQPSPKKSTTKRENRISQESFAILNDEAPIEIFTDSENRLPKVDNSAENPFYGDSGIAASAVPVRRSARNKKSVILEKQIVEANLQRDDGVLYVFRGKKVFRKFTDGEASARPTVKPRLLFPSSKPTKENELIAEEEAETDIEEQQAAEVSTPTEAIVDKVNTPKAPKFAPASPPATARTTRSKKIIADEPTPAKVKGKRASGRSPFDGWQRTKSSPSTAAHGIKRSGDHLARDSSPKRTKV
ncbi:hypothetical protein BD289DRAFT_480087 [Coniella lustricola]|uniref:Uncharacterized protein n=1 Tax=Coniella lustricola TaxID=2025994 RepID=A0A2T3AGR6_9PEZI|nr:hypothetical protein BD289DRAFT_480087 [Coniella lustricola]